MIAAGLRVLGDDGVVGAEIHAAIERPHPLRREHADVDLVAVDDVLAGHGALGRHLDRRHLASELLLQKLHGLERMIDRLLADHQAEPRQVAADHVVEGLVAGMALDVLEQQRRAFFHAHEIGDVRGFEIGVDLGGDALELAHRLGLLQPAGRDRWRCGGRRGWIVSAGSTVVACPPALIFISMTLLLARLERS